MTTDTKLEREVAAIGDLQREELAALWEKAYGCSPPKGVKRGLLERSAAWHLQANRLGGYSAATRKVLRQAAHPMPGDGTARDGDRAGADTERKARRRSTVTEPVATGSARAPLRPGTRLVREWNGRMHAVDVMEDGFLFDGRTYRSLSAIARRITGAHWSGPRFFGV